MIFWAFFALFLISTPAAILYSQGYRFDQYSQIFIHSGSVTVKSVPSSASVYLNNELQTGNSLDIINNSFTLNGLRPGTYTIRVSADGYQDWEKQVEVHSGISTEYWSIFLASKNPSVQELSASSIDRFFSSPFGKYVALVNNEGGELKISAYDIKNNETLANYGGNGIEFSKNKTENLEWNFKERLILAPVLRNEKKDYLVYDIEKEYDTLFLSKLTNLSDFHGARWSPNDQWTLYFLARDAEEGDIALQGLFSYDILTKKLMKITDDTLAFDFSGNNIYSMRSNNIIYKLDIDGVEISQITVSPISDGDLGDNSRLIVYDENRQAVLSQDGSLFMRNSGTEDTTRQIFEKATDVQFSDDGKKMLFWNNNEIDVIFLRAWDVQPQRKENEIQKILRSSTPFDNVFWFRDYEHIIFSSSNKIRIIELDPRDHRISMNIFENNLDSFPVTYDSGNNNLYYIRNGNAPRTLYQMQLLPRPGLFGQQ
jgi:hypothetical protein